MSMSAIAFAEETTIELGIPTVSSVAKLKQTADDLYARTYYRKAADAYATYAEQAEWLANIISGGIEPYNNASYDDVKNWYPSFFTFDELSYQEDIYEKENSQITYYFDLYKTE